MPIPRWSPSSEITRQERVLLKRLDRTRKLFAFLRQHRLELFDDGFQTELASMYRATGAGKVPVPPALIAMVVLLQAYLGVSDAEAVELCVVDLRWQMVLGCLGAEEPPLSQGAIVDFRARLIAHDMDRRLLERTVELAKRTREFDWRKLPKQLHVAIDSKPLEGAGRVEDTFNLLGHAARKIVTCVAAMLERTVEDLAREIDLPILLGTSVKQALDVQWSDPAHKDAALQDLVAQLDRLERWLGEHLTRQMTRPPLREAVQTLRQLRAQDLEPDPPTGKTRIREGTAPDRRVSVEDADMRHGRKSKTKLFNGFKEHIAMDLDTDLILAGVVLPANRPEEEAIPTLEKDLAHAGVAIGSLYIDRGYIRSPLVERVLADGGQVLCRPYVARNGNLFAKSEFRINLRRGTITCPAGQTQRARLGSVVQFDPATCDRCSLRDRCTDAARGHGRTVSIAPDEPLQQRLQKQAATPLGRFRLRTRSAVEHRLAHVARCQGRRARYRGSRKNVFDLRRTAAVLNLETIQRVADQADLRRAA